MSLQMTVDIETLEKMLHRAYQYGIRYGVTYHKRLIEEARKQRKHHRLSEFESNLIREEPTADEMLDCQNPGGYLVSSYFDLDQLLVDDDAF